MDEATELLRELMETITTVHVDMGGKHRYALSHKTHPIITRIEYYLYNQTYVPREDDDDLATD